jgi:hypothetical protein
MESPWSQDDPLGADWAPLVRAVAFFDIFRGEIENGGVSQYLFNRASGLPHFAEAPQIVRQHPLLGNVANLKAEGHGHAALVSHFVKAQTDHHNVVAKYVWSTEEYDTGGLITRNI